MKGSESPETAKHQENGANRHNFIYGFFGGNRAAAQTIRRELGRDRGCCVGDGLHLALPFYRPWDENVCVAASKTLQTDTARGQLKIPFLVA
jgi:hypothetical protein